MQKNNKTNCAELIEKAKRGDTVAFAAIVRQFYGLVMHYLLGMGIKYADAEDVAQEAFINVFKKIHQVTNPSTFSAWLLRIARNLFIDKLRKESKIKLSGGEYELELLKTDMTPEDEVVSSAKVDDIFSGLKAREKVILELRVFQGMAFAEIAELQDMSEGNVRLVFHRMIIKLREKLTKEFGVAENGK
jgi:RNA polymerase sigma-70 factor (ECF subfamily)